MTATRWARVLKRLGHRLQVVAQYRGGPCDALIALHARRSRQSVLRFRKAYPDRPVILALTGTDLYRDIHSNPSSRLTLDWATRLVMLQPLGIRQLPRRLRSKAVAITQSAVGPRRRRKPRDGLFEVCVIGHLRPVKDPFRAALAARLLPVDSRIRILHLGSALSRGMSDRARRESRDNPRYRWLGEVSHAKALHVLSGCRLMVLSSRLEGGANVIGEALACRVPVLCSKIDGSVGLLGPSYPGYFPVGDTRALTKLLSRAERDSRFLSQLQAYCRQRAPIFEPKREEKAWADLLRAVSA